MTNSQQALTYLSGQINEKKQLVEWIRTREDFTASDERTIQSLKQEMRELLNIIELLIK